MLFYNLLEEQLRKIYIIEDKKLTQDCIRKMSDEEFKELYTDYAKKKRKSKMFANLVNDEICNPTNITKYKKHFRPRELNVDGKLMTLPIEAILFEFKSRCTEVNDFRKEIVHSTELITGRGSYGVYRAILFGGTTEELENAKESLNKYCNLIVTLFGFLSNEYASFAKLGHGIPYSDGKQINWFLRARS
ncbi:MAG: hypothetical protein O3A66_02170 [Proteobacteria bacterium]|nr:hypothetical protein [Pseudomonadota bacterium]